VLGIFLNPFYFTRRPLYKSLSRLSASLHGKLLDFGCGAKPYADLFRTEAYIGVDIENTAHSHEGENIDVYFNGQDLPFNDKSFDSIFTSQTLEHVKNFDTCLDEMLRVAKDDARFLFTIPFVWDEHEVPYDFRRFTSFGIKEALEKRGFEIIAYEKSGSFPEVVIQLWILMLYYIIRSKNKYINLLLTLIFISPMNILGTIFAYIINLLMPHYKSHLFFDNIVLARKKS
jgi:SAM-dependent methyltransferase